MSNILEAIKIRLIIIKSSLIYEAQNELAYKSTNIATLASTSMYTVVYLLFIEVIFTNTDSLGTYGRNEMMFFYFIGQILAFTTFSYVMSANQLIDDIRNGNLDFIFLRPTPSLIFVNVRKFNVVSFIRDGMPPLILIALTVRWNELSLSQSHILEGSFFLIIGLIIINNLHMIAAMSTFWFGQAKGIYGLTNEFTFDVNTIVPIDTLPKALQNAFIRLVPIVFATGVSTAVMLGNIEFESVFPFALAGLLYFEAMKQLLWKAAMRRYTSASS